MFECGCCAFVVFKVCGAKRNFHVFSLYRNPDLVGRICDCLTSIAAMQVDYVRASFLFLSDRNRHHQELLGSMTLNRHGVVPSDFATVSGFYQLVVGRSHARGFTLHLLMTDVVDLVPPDCCCNTIVSMTLSHTLSCRTGSALAWQSEGRTFAAHSVQ